MGKCHIHQWKVYKIDEASWFSQWNPIGDLENFLKNFEAIWFLPSVHTERSILRSVVIFVETLRNILNTVRAPLQAAACIFFYPISKDHLCTVIFGLMYGLYSRAASNQERPMMARVRYARTMSKTLPSISTGLSIVSHNAVSLIKFIM